MLGAAEPHDARDALGGRHVAAGAEVEQVAHCAGVLHGGEEVEGCEQLVGAGEAEEDGGDVVGAEEVFDPGGVLNAAFFYRYVGGGGRGQFWTVVGRRWRWEG